MKAGVDNINHDKTDLHGCALDCLYIQIVAVCIYNNSASNNGSATLYCALLYIFIGVRPLRIAAD